MEEEDEAHSAEKSSTAEDKKQQRLDIEKLSWWREELPLVLIYIARRGDREATASTAAATTNAVTHCNSNSKNKAVDEDDDGADEKEMKTVMMVGEKDSSNKPTEITARRTQVQLMAMVAIVKMRTRKRDDVETRGDE